jgi:hypothetical protein
MDRNYMAKINAKIDNILTDNIIPKKTPNYSSLSTSPFDFSCNIIWIIIGILIGVLICYLYDYFKLRSVQDRPVQHYNT